MNERSCGRTPMSSKIDPGLGRRGFLKGVVAATGAAPMARQSLVATGLAVATVLTENRAARAQTTSGIGIPNLPSPEAGYQSLSPDEAGFVEAMVNIMCPADSLTPSGLDCGLAVYIDRQLAGGFGKGEKLYLQGPWRQGTPQHGDEECQYHLGRKISRRVYRDTTGASARHDHAICRHPKFRRSRRPHCLFGNAEVTLRDMRRRAVRMLAGQLFGEAS